MKKTKQIDSRIIRTRQLLQNALIELLEEMEVDRITVSLLAKRAKVNRVTFYHHYRGIEDMIIQVADQLIEEVSSIFNSKNEIQSQIDWHVTKQFLEHIIRNQNMYKFLLINQRIAPFREKLLKLISQHLEELQNQWQVADMGVQKDVLVWRDSYAFIGIIEVLLSKGMPYTPKYLIKQFNLMYELNYFGLHRSS